jgi:hypothetical protein
MAAEEVDRLNSIMKQFCVVIVVVIAVVVVVDLFFDSIVVSSPNCFLLYHCNKQTASSYSQKGGLNPGDVRGINDDEEEEEDEGDDEASVPDDLAGVS